MDIRDFGCVGDNATDNTANLQAAITKASSSGAPLCVPSGVFRHTGLLWGDGVTMRGVGTRSVLQCISAGTGIDCTGKADWRIQDILMRGIASVTEGTYPTVGNIGVGIKINGCTNWRLRDVGVNRFGSGIQYENSPNWGAKGTATDIDLSECFKGILTQSSGEYGTFSARLDRCTFGIHVDSGNNTFMGCQVVRSGVAIKLSGGVNNAHGQFIGGHFNHSNYNLEINDAVSLGETFVGCHFIGDAIGGNAGTIRIKNSRGITLANCQIGANIIVDGLPEGASPNVNGTNMMMGCYVRTLPGSIAPAISNGGVLLCKLNYTDVGLWAYNN